MVTVPLNDGLVMLLDEGVEERLRADGYGRIWARLNLDPPGSGNPRGYATAHRIGTTSPRGIHRIILSYKLGRPIAKTERVDHISHELIRWRVIDNRFENLRLSTPAQNIANSRRQYRGSSMYKGVSWWKQHSRWRADIRINYKKFFLGGFADEETAARAYDAAAIRAWGEYALLNFPS